GQSIGRKVLADGTEQDTDNNSNDFELQIPTPYAQNETYVDSSTQPTPSPLPTPSPTPMPVVPLKNILINEIQIDSVAGTGGTDDDWVELYNPNDSPVSLAGWSIQKSGYSKTNCSVNTSFYSKQFDSSAVVPANGFYLVVSTKANDSLKALAVPPNGMTIGWSLSDNNTIYLVKNTDKITDYKDADIVEEVGYGTACFSEGDSPAISPPDGGSIERKKLGTDTDNNLADFKISNDPTPNAASPKSYIQDATNYSTCMTTTNPGTTFYNLDIKWNSLTLNLDHYQIQYNLNGGTWQDWLAATTDTEKTFQTAYSLYQDKIYIFRARTYDKDGNVGDWAEITIDLSNPVVINEVAYYGIGDTTLNHKQWMELYNRSGNPIDLTGWQIVSNNNNYLNVILKGTIPANGYFILEREDDSAGAVSDVSANQTFSGVIPTGDMIYLKNQNNRQMDEFYSDRSQGQSQENGNYYSLERISPYSFGQDSKNWELSNSAGFGTPNRQNSVYQLYTSNFTNSFVEDTTLKASLSPYLFQDSTYIFPGITLTIEPGTVIKFSGDHPNLTVDGTLNAIGAAGQPIVFTSVADADYGGTGQANPGQWAGIHFNKDSSGASDLENIIVRYAGANIYAQDYGAGISIESSSITLKNSVIEKNLNSGLKMHGSSSTIDSVQFNGNQEIDSDTLYGKAIYNEDGSPSITNCVFKGNYDAIYLTNGGTDDNAPVISGNDFENNNDAAIYVSGKDIYPDFSGNKAAGNGHNAIVFTEQIEKSMTMQNDLPYLVKEALNVPQNTTLTIQPGTIVKFSDSSLAVDGTLNAVGATGQPIVFTSVDDDDYGGHMENSNDTSPVEPGQWSGIIFKNDSAGSDLENIVLRYAGGTLGGNFGAGIEVENSIIS
ncbi:MAG: lamin tail domain-containing protein, partial [Candidatus Staskawiczbacteria bacterium]